LVATEVTQFVERKIVSCGDNKCSDEVTPLAVGRSGYCDIDDVVMTDESCLNIFGPYLFSTRVDDVAPPSFDVKASVASENPEIAGREPAIVGEWRGAVSIATKQHRPFEVYLIISNVNLNSIEWHAVVDDTAARFGQTIGSNAVRRPVGWWPCATKNDVAES
jgi:hypothetical protein